MMEGIHHSGAVDKRTMREFDDACLGPSPRIGEGSEPSEERVRGLELCNLGGRRKKAPTPTWPA
jgi:hypothetical protein